MNKKNKMPLLIAVVALMVLGATSVFASEESIMDTIHDLGYEYIGWQEEDVTYRSGEIYSDHIGMDQDPPTGVISATAADLDGDGQEELLLVLLEETEREYDTSGGKDSRLAFLVCENQDGKWIESQSISTAVRYGTEEQENMATIADVLVSTTVELFPTEEGYHILVNHPFYTVFAGSAYETVIERTEIIYSEESITGIKCTSDDEEEFHRLLEIMSEDNDILVSRIYLSKFFENKYYDLNLTSYENFLNGGEASVTLYLQDFGNLSGIDDVNYVDNQASAEERDIGYYEDSDKETETGESDGIRAAYSKRPEYYASDYVILPDYMGISIPDVSTETVTDTDVEEKISEFFAEESWDFVSLDAITDEQASILSNQNYTTAQEFIDTVRENLELEAEYIRKSAIFDNIFNEIEDKVLFIGYPEDVYEYLISQHMADEETFQTGLWTMDEIREILGNNYEEYAQMVEQALYYEMMFQCMAEQQGIAGGSDYAYQVLMAQKGCFSREDLLNCYEYEDDLPVELLKIDVIDYVVSQADISDSEGNIITSENTEDWSDYGAWEEYTYDSGDSYTGFMKNGEFSTWGIYKFASGSVYEGQFKNDNFNGYGIFTDPNGSKYKGEFKDGEMEGLGAQFLEDRFIILGEFSNRTLNGYGAVYMDGSLMEFGLYQNGELIEDGISSSDGYGFCGFTFNDDFSISGEGISFDSESATVGEIYPDGSRYILTLWSNGAMQIGLYDSEKMIKEGIFINPESEETEYVIGSFVENSISEGLVKWTDGTWCIGQYEEGAYVEGSGITSLEIF